MIKTLFLVLATATPAAVFAQDSLDCSRVMTGTFKIADNGVILIIKRTAKYQIEIVDQVGYKSKSRIRWESPCTYVVYDTKVLRGDSSGHAPGQEVIVTITAVNPSSYWATVTTNFDDQVMHMVVDILE